MTDYTDTAIDAVATWEPLPVEVAEWMGATELGERAREVPPPYVVVPRQVR